ncbi:MAG: hypothetical protein ACI9KE_003370 [Polyangiales bacterium]|jgi:hypothetical protein
MPGILRTMGTMGTGSAVMSSHVHLALLAGETKFAKWAHPLNTRFAKWISWKRRLTDPKTLGPVFGDRPSTYSLPLEQSAWTIAYHHRNPKDAGIVRCPADSTWTSHRAYLGLSAPQAGLNVALGLELAGFPDSDEGRRSFHRFVCETTLATDRARHGGMVSTGPQQPTLPEIVERVIDVFSEPGDVLSAARTQRAALVRRTVISVARCLGYSVTEAARYIGISQSGASRLLARNHDVELVAAHARFVLKGLSRKS